MELQHVRELQRVRELWEHSVTEFLSLYRTPRTGTPPFRTYSNPYVNYSTGFYVDVYHSLGNKCLFFEFVLLTPPNHPLLKSITWRLHHIHQVQPDPCTPCTPWPPCTTRYPAVRLHTYSESSPFASPILEYST